MKSTYQFLNHYLLLIAFVLLGLFTTQSASAATTDVVVNAYGEAKTECTGDPLVCVTDYPLVNIYINGTQVGATQTITETNSTGADYTITNVTIPNTGNIDIDVHFINDGWCGSPPRTGCTGDVNFFVNSVTIGHQTIPSANETVDKGGSYAQATDGVDTYIYNDIGSMGWSSALRLTTVFGNCCSSYVIGEYHLDEPSWNGTANEVIDASGNNHHGYAINNASTYSINRAIEGSNGTCGYGEFMGVGKGIKLPAFPQLKDSTSITAWVKAKEYASGSWNRIFEHDSGGSYGYGLRMNNNGKLTYFKRKASGHVQLDSPTVLNKNEWYFVAVTVDSSASTASIHIYNQSGTLLNTTSSTAFTSAYTSLAPTSSQAAIGMQLSGNNSFEGNIDEVRVYQGALTQLELSDIHGQTRPCSAYNTQVDASAFNCIAEKETDPDQGHLYMAIANKVFNIKVYPLKADRTVETDFSKAGAKEVSLQFIDQSNISNPVAINFKDPDTGTNVTSKTLTFPEGVGDDYVAINNLTIPNAYRDLVCRITDATPATPVIGTSFDNFSVRPLNLTITSTPTTASVNDGIPTANADSMGSDPEARGIGNNELIAAGDFFTLSAASDTVGYDGTPLAHGSRSRYQSHTGGFQAGVVKGDYDTPNKLTGTTSGTNFFYSEVGYFKMLITAVYDRTFTSVDVDKNDCIKNYNNGRHNSSGQYGCYLRNNDESAYFGRFKPHHFRISGVTSTMSVAGCELGLTTDEINSNQAFTYYGVSGGGVLTSFNIRADDKLNRQLKNYIGPYAKLDINTWTDLASGGGFQFSMSNALPAGVELKAYPVTPNPVVTSQDGTWVQGAATVKAHHYLTRPATPTVQIFNYIQARPLDSDGVTTINNVTDLIVTSKNVLSSRKRRFRYGRLQIANNDGPTQQSLTVPVIAQYWNSNRYANNTLDNCTSINGMILGSYTKNLEVGETTLSGEGLLSKGKLNLQLSAPGAENDGSVNLNFKLTNYDSFGIDGIDDPEARATFNSKISDAFKAPIIYLRENF